MRSYLGSSPPITLSGAKKYRYGRRATSTANQQSQTVNRLRFFWTRIWGKTCVWKRS
ncbi:MAG: hypothetical protein VB143_07320 [Burkholderia sp.]